MERALLLRSLSSRTSRAGSRTYPHSPLCYHSRLLSTAVSSRLLQSPPDVAGRSLGDGISGGGTRRGISNPPSKSSTKIQIMIRSFEPIEDLHWELPPHTREVNLPPSRKLYTVIRGPHVHKSSREQFESRIYKKLLVINAERHELQKKLFWLKRQRLFGAQFEILFSYKTRLDKGILQRILPQVNRERGISKKDSTRKAELLVMSMLKSLVEEGYNKDVVEASLNQIEFPLQENNTGSFPCGLALMLRSIPLPALKARIEKEGSRAVFAPLIEKLILNNPHRLTVQNQKCPQDEAAERQHLEKLKASMNEDDVAELARVTHELRLKHETRGPLEAPKAVPSLSLHDIPKKPVQVPTNVGDINGVKVLQHDLFTNDVMYTDVLFDMSSLKQDLLPMVPLFCESLLQMGTKDLDFVQLNQLIGSKTGEISVYPFTSSKRSLEDPVSHIIVRGKAMSAHTEDLFNLVNRILQDTQFTDQKHFKLLVSQSKARIENRLKGSGYGIAAARMNAKLNSAGWVAEQMGGVSYLEFLKDLEHKVEQDWDGISASLEEIRQALLSKKGCLVNLTSDGNNLKASEIYVSKLLDMLPSTSQVTSAAWNARLPSTNEAIVIPSQLNYVGKAANIYESGYQLKGSAHVISKYISNTWLWDRIRVGGGAFGGLCYFDTHSGIFSFLSYQDPNLLKTLDVYDGTSDFLRQLKLDDDTLKKAIMGTIGDIDLCLLPDAKGYNSLLQYLLGITEEERQARHEEILSTSLKDFKEFADAMNAVKDKGVVVAVTSQDEVDAANKERSNFFEIKKAL